MYVYVLYIYICLVCTYIYIHHTNYHSSILFHHPENSTCYQGSGHNMPMVANMQIRPCFSSTALRRSKSSLVQSPVELKAPLDHRQKLKICGSQLYQYIYIYIFMCMYIYIYIYISLYHIYTHQSIHVYHYSVYLVSV